jgi:Sec-independent protein secretion pathway component TatC
MPLEGWFGFGFDPLRIGSCVELGTVLALPFIISQGWGYLRPGAGSHEVAWRRKLLAVAVAVELAAVVVGFYLVLPWLDHVSNLSADYEHQAHQAVLAAPSLLLLTVLVFELPVFTFGLAVARSPLLTSEG